MTTTPILLLSGKGKTGRRVADHLGARQVPVRLASRSSEHSGAVWTIIRPAWFMQGFSEDFLVEYVLADQIRLSAGTGAEPWIDVNDVAEVVTAALLDERHDGQTYSLSGPRTLTMSEVAAELTTATGRPIEYAGLDPEQHVNELTEYGLTREDAESIRDLFAVIRNHRSEYLSDGVQQVLGREPRDFSDWARETAATGVWAR